MTFYDKVLKHKFRLIHRKTYWFATYQPSHDTPPITKQSEGIKLNDLTDVEGLDSAYGSKMYPEYPIRSHAESFYTLRMS